MPVLLKDLIRYRHVIAKRRVLDFLKRNRKYGWSVNEIAEKLGMSRNTCAGAIKKLLEEGKIKRKMYKRYYCYFYQEKGKHGRRR